MVFVGRHVAGLLGVFQLRMVREDHCLLDQLAESGVDRMGGVGVELGAAIGIADGALLVELVSAVVAVAGSQMILAAALGAAVSQLAAGHGDEQSFVAFDDLEVTDDKLVVEGDGAECAQARIAVSVLFHELDADFGDLHWCVSLGCETRC